MRTTYNSRIICLESFLAIKDEQAKVPLLNQFYLVEGQKHRNYNYFAMQNVLSAIVVETV